MNPVRPRKVFLTGGEGVNWALDHDLLHLRRILGGSIEEVDARSCELIHSVWWRGLLQLPEEVLAHKVVVASIADSPATVLGTPEFGRLRDWVDLWLVEYAEAQKIFTRAGLPCLRFPDPIHADQFAPAKDRTACRAALCAREKIPGDRWIVGNFHRDSSMEDLGAPKKQKGADLFLALVRAARAKGIPLHPVLAGPRRHWIRARLREYGIPFTYVGEEISEDDCDRNTLSLGEVAEIYRSVDLYLIPSRWEGAPNSVLEAALTETPVLSTPVGQVPDLLVPGQIFGGLSEGVRLLEEVWRSGFPPEWLFSARQRVLRWNSDAALAARLRHIHDMASRLQRGSQGELPTRLARRLRYNRPVRKWRQWTGKRSHPEAGMTIALWNDFRPPPYGGGNQFLLALEKEFQRRGIRVQRNEGRGADAHILQAIWVDRKKFEKERQPGSVVIHRIDGPIQLYRGPEFHDDDERCFRMNRELADITVMQSLWSLLRTRDMRFEPYRPVVIPNAADPEIFYPSAHPNRSPDGRIRLISTSWSDNPRKGRATYEYLDQNLDFTRYRYTFVGRIQADFKNIEVIDPVPSEQIADLLRAHDLYVTASRNDPCSNALVEALSCGLPTVYYDGGGHRELVGWGGKGFTKEQHLLPVLQEVAENYKLFRTLIWPSTIQEVAKKYIAIIQSRG